MYYLLPHFFRSKYMMLTTKNLIDWDRIIFNISPRSGDPITMSAVLNKSEHARTDKQLMSDYEEIAKTWLNAGYNLENIKWYDYYPGEHFDKSIETAFENLVNAKARRVWISEIMPGITSPYHWDVEDYEQQWLSEGNLVRYTCFIEQPTDGHIFVLEDHHFYNPEQHLVIKWENHRHYHAGSNCGFKPFYLFHFLGTSR